MNVYILVAILLVADGRRVHNGSRGMESKTPSLVGIEQPNRKNPRPWKDLASLLLRIGPARANVLPSREENTFLLADSKPPLAFIAGSALLAPRLSQRSVAPIALAPTGVDGLPFEVQQGLFAETFIALCASAVSIDAAYRAFQREKPDWWWDAWEVGSALLLGAIFVTAGRSHFTKPEAFIGIYPPQGTWGFWYLPGSPEFHVAWTGIAELSGGSGLLLSGAISALALVNADLVKQLVTSGRSPLLPLSARALFLLVLCVTPANFLMFSHGATMPGVVEGTLSMGWHAVRFFAQVSILSVLYTLSAEKADASAALEERPA